jgi:hypothetical protein
MKRFAILICLFGLVQGSEVVSAGSFPWVRTRPKPVLLEPEDQTSTKTPNGTQPRVAWHGTAAYPGSGRLYFPDTYDHTVQPAQARKPRVSDAVARGWRGQATPSQAKK